MYQLEYMYQCRRIVSFEAKKGFSFVSLRSENWKRKEAKRSKKIELNFSSEQAKHMRNGSNFASFRL
jgi:hypothetical protein